MRIHQKKLNKTHQKDQEEGIRLHRMQGKKRYLVFLIGFFGGWLVGWLVLCLDILLQNPAPTSLTKYSYYVQWQPKEYIEPENIAEYLK